MAGEAGSGGLGVDPGLHPGLGGFRGGEDAEVGDEAVAEGEDVGVGAVAEVGLGFEADVDADGGDDDVADGEKVGGLAGALGPGGAGAGEVGEDGVAAVAGGAAGVLGGLGPEDVRGEGADGCGDVVAVERGVEVADGFEVLGLLRGGMGHGVGVTSRGKVSNTRQVEKTKRSCMPNLQEKSEEAVGRMFCSYPDIAFRRDRPCGGYGGKSDSHGEC